VSLLLAVVAVGAVGSAPAAAGAPPTIDVWYGDVQTVGERGRTQQWANVLGNVSDIDDTVTSLTYSLNGGPDQPLTIGRDNHPRLVRYGDFNVEIDRADLVAGDNAVVITATDEEGNRSHRTVTLVNTPSVTWPLPTSVRWDGVTTPSEVVDVVDGRWSASSSGARIVETGYDRLFAVGDMTWTDYEVEVPVTIHDMDTNVGGVGLFMRWTGHTEEPPHEAGMQPRLGWQPSGSLAWYRARFGHPARVELATDEEDVLAADTSGFSLAMGSTYVFRARVQRTPAGDDYRMTVFPAGQPESAGVTVTALDTAFRKDAGSVLFIAHRAAVTFGDITVTEIDGEPPPPPPNEAPVAADDAVSTAVDVPVSVDVLANDSDPDGSLVPSSVAVASGPASGSVSVDPASGAVRYAPNPGFVGSDAFSYTVDDDDGATSNVATVSVTVSAGPPPPNEAPVAVDDAVSTAVDVPVTVDVLANDSDSDGSLVPSSVAVVDGPASGSVSVEPASGAVTYAPNPAFEGSDAFTYTMDDDDGATSNVATVSVTVSAAPPPPSSGLVSDEFSTPSLGSHWSWFDPVGDASRVATGSHAALSVPEGVSHDLWTGALRAPRLLQSADDVDFEVEVKIDSPVTSAYQFQGLVVQQDADDLIRFEVHHDGGSPRVFVATITDGVASERRNVRAPAEAPYWLRVAREGDTWTFQSSGDGVTWNTVATVTHAMSVAQAGVFVGNHTPSPQHTAAIDYFRVS
jgi:regulation of enolase protein 1 (concanavalin A-like superfamily)